MNSQEKTSRIYRPHDKKEKLEHISIAEKIGGIQVRKELKRLTSPNKRTSGNA